MRLTVHGPTKLSGCVEVQGAKNSAMKHAIIPLLVNDKFVLENIPRISSITNLLEIVKSQGAEVDWLDKNTVEVDTSDVKKPVPIPSKLFYHTSGATLLIPILVSRYGSCEVELMKGRNDTGGDQIGRSLEAFHASLQNMGIEVMRAGTHATYGLKSRRPFRLKVPGGSFGVSVTALLSALLRDGVSEIINPTRVVEFGDVVNLLKRMGAGIGSKRNRLLVTGKKGLKGTSYRNMYDRHDFITFLSAALSTASAIEIRNVNYNSMKLACLEDFIEQSGIAVEFDKSANTCYVHENRIRNLRPIELIAKGYPMFVTEWQVLLSPLFAQLPGTSTIIEAWFTNRMRHWDELGKMGAKFEYFTHPDFPEEDGAPRAVKVLGPIKFHGAKVSAKDVRSGAALLIAAMAARGTTKILDKEEHIRRGYESLPERLISLGAKIEIESWGME